MVKHKKREHDFAVNAFRVVQEATGQTTKVPMSLKGCPFRSVIYLYYTRKGHHPENLFVLAESTVNPRLRLLSEQKKIIGEKIKR